MVEIAPYPGRESDLEFFTAVNDFYNGNVLSTSYIHPHRSERPLSKDSNAPHVDDRIKRTPYENLVKPVVIKHTAMLAQPAVVTGVDTADELLTDIDGQGNSLEAIRNEIVKQFLIEGRVCLLAEAPSVRNETAADDSATNQRPYLALIPAENIFKYSKFASGPRGGKLSELAIIVGEEMIEDRKHTRLRRYYFPEGGNKYYVQNLVIESDKLKNPGNKAITFDLVGEEMGPFYEEIPARVFGRASESSLMDGTWQRAAHILNMRSLYVELIYRQAFRVTIVGNTGAGDEENFKTLSESVVILTKGQVSVDTVDPADFSQIDQYIDKREAALIKTADHRLIQLTVADSKQQQSAESKAKDEAPKIHIYNEILDLMSRELTYMLRYMAFFNNIAIKDTALMEISVNFEREFGLEDSELDILRLEQIASDAEDYDDETQLAIKTEITKLKIAAVSNETARAAMLEALESAQLRPRGLAVLPRSLGGDGE